MEEENVGGHVVVCLLIWFTLNWRLQTSMEIMGREKGEGCVSLETVTMLCGGKVLGLHT